MNGWALALVLLARLHSLEEEGFQHFYSLDYDRARAAFEALSRKEPQSPAGPHYLASVVWLEELTRRGAMAGETFQTARYWTRVRPEPLAPEVERAFHEQSEESLRRSRALLAADEQDRVGLYFLGATESLKSGYQITLKRSYFGAYLAARRASKHHQKLIDLDPGLGDAYMVPGLYEYALATLPRSTKWLAFLIGVRGSKERGLAYLERAAREGLRTQRDAQLMLTVIAERQKKYGEALARLREFERRFPGNPLYPLERGWVELLQKRWPQAQATFSSVLARLDAGAGSFRRVRRSLVMLRLAEAQLYDGQFGLAIENLERAMAEPGLPAELRASLLLRRGQAWDGQKDRERALADYDATIALNVDRASRRAAEQYRKTPFQLVH